MVKTELPPEWAAAVRRFRRKRDAKALAWAIGAGIAAGVALALIASVVLAHVLTLGSYPIAP